MILNCSYKSVYANLKLENCTFQIHRIGKSKSNLARNESFGELSQEVREWQSLETEALRENVRWISHGVQYTSALFT